MVEASEARRKYSMKKNASRRSFLQTSTKQLKPVCICAAESHDGGITCAGLTSGFAIFRDPRGGFVELPPTSEDLMLENVSTAQQIRRAYLHHLLPQSKGDNLDKHTEKRGESPPLLIALHHFHPDVVLYSCSDDMHLHTPGPVGHSILRTISGTTMRHLRLKLTEEDLLRPEDEETTTTTSSEDKTFDGGKNENDDEVYIFVPTYTYKKAKRDLKKLVLGLHIYQTDFSETESTMSIRGSDDVEGTQKVLSADHERAQKEMKKTATPPTAAFTFGKLGFASKGPTGVTIDDVGVRGHTSALIKHGSHRRIKSAPVDNSMIAAIHKGGDMEKRLLAPLALNIAASPKSAIDTADDWKENGDFPGDLSAEESLSADDPVLVKDEKGASATEAPLTVNGSRRGARGHKKAATDPLLGDSLVLTDTGALLDKSFALLGDSLAVLDMHEQLPMLERAAQDEAAKGRSAVPGPMRQSLRKAHMASLAVMEYKRRSWAMTELRKMRCEWSCYDSVLQNMLRETDDAFGLVSRSYQAMSFYAASITTICMDCFTDDDGNIALLEEEDKSGSRSWPLWKQNTSLEAQRKREAQKTAKVDQVDGQPGILKPLLDAFLTVEGGFAEHLPSLRQCANDMARLHSEVRAGVTLFKDRYQSLTGDLKRTESKVRGKWSQLEDLCSEQLLSERSIDFDVGPPMEPIRRKDRWLVEVAYRAAVGTKLAVWKKCCQDLESLLNEIVQLEEYRVSRTKEILLEFLPKRRRMFLGSRETLDSAEQEMESHILRRDEVDEAIEETLQILHESSATTNAPTRFLMMSIGSSGGSVGRLPAMDNLICDWGKSDHEMAKIMTDLHLQSNLVHEVKSVDVSIGKLNDWTKALAVTTVKQNLYVFALENDFNGPYCDTLEWFEDAVLNETHGPVVSVRLTDCTYGLSVDGGHVELIIPPVKDKVWLRFGTNREATQWLTKTQRWTLLFSKASK